MSGDRLRLGTPGEVIGDIRDGFAQLSRADRRVDEVLLFYRSWRGVLGGEVIKVTREDRECLHVVEIQFEGQQVIHILPANGFWQVISRDALWEFFRSVKLLPDHMAVNRRFERGEMERNRKLKNIR